MAAASFVTPAFAVTIDYVAVGNAGTADDAATGSLYGAVAYGMNLQSAYGTNDQAGNVWEWNDAVISGSSRGLRGGAYIGFRVASDPEPLR